MIFHLNNSVSLSDIQAEFDVICRGETDSISSVASLDCSDSNSLSFSSKELTGTTLGVVIVVSNLCLDKETLGKTSVIHSDNPRLLFSRIVNYLIETVGFNTFNYESQIHPTATVAPSAVIEEGCVIAEGVKIEPNVVVHKGSRIGANSIVRGNSVIGTQGFGFERDPELGGTPVPFPHLGGVVIEENVEIGPCTVIAKGALSDTLIRKNCKINSLCHVAHHCDLGENSYIMAGVVLSGGAKVGKNSWIGTNATVRQKITIGSKVTVGSGAVVVKDIRDGLTVVGNPARNLTDKDNS